MWTQKVKVVRWQTWHPWHFGSADSESGLRFLKFLPQNPYGQIWIEKVKVVPFS